MDYLVATLRGLGFNDAQLDSQIRSLRRDGESDSQIISTIRARAGSDVRTPLPTRREGMTLENSGAANFYGYAEDLSQEVVPFGGVGGQVAPLPLVGGALVAVSAATLAQHLGPSAVRVAVNYIRKFSVNGIVRGWGSLPGWIKAVLAYFGIDEGMDFFFQDTEPEYPELGPAGPGVQIIGSWNTNPNDPERGQVFYRLSDGRLATQKQTGQWKIWRPKKPIVLYAAGAGNLKTMLRADTAVAKQMKRLDKAMRRRGIRKVTPRSKDGAKVTTRGMVTREL